MLGADVSVPLPGRIRLFAIDVDGTLLDSRHELSAATKAAISHVRNRGVEVLLASSRGPVAMEAILLALRLTDPVAFVASQGAITASYSSDHTLRLIDQQSMPTEAAQQIVRAAAEVGISVNWFAGAHWYVSTVDHTVASEARIVGATPTVRDLLAETTGPDKLMLIAPTNDPAPLRRIAERLPTGLKAQTSNPTYLEITRADVDKASAVARYCAQRGIPAASVVALGDGPNDLGLFAYAGTSIAPANARAQVLAAATLLTRSNDADGVAHALTTLVP